MKKYRSPSHVRCSIAVICNSAFMAYALRVTYQAFFIISFLGRERERHEGGGGETSFPGMRCREGGREGMVAG